MMAELRNRLKRRESNPVDPQEKLKEEMKKRYEEMHTPAVKPETPLFQSKARKKKSSSSSSHYSD